MGIITNADLKDWLKLEDDDDDTRITSAVTAANRAVVNYCGRSFEKTAIGAESPRVYSLEDRADVEIHDFWDTTNLVVKTDDNNDGTYETTWTLTTDYVVEPFNGLDGEMLIPFYRLAAVGIRRFPVFGRRPRLQVTAAWGWAAVPDDIRTATLIKASRLFKRKDSPEGILGGWADVPGVRVTQKEDPDAMALLRPYRRVSAIALIG